MDRTQCAADLTFLANFGATWTANNQNQKSFNIWHISVEKARRLFIDAKIRELGTLLPSRDEM